MKLYSRFIFQKLFFSFCLIYCIVFLSVFFSDWLIQRESSVVPIFLDLALVRFELLVPISMLIALIHTLTTLKVNHEILALQCFGVTKKEISTPFFVFCLLFIPFYYLNTEYLIPLAKPYLVEEKIDSIELPSAFLVKQLNDGSTIAYQMKDQELFDFYWIQSTSDLWHAKSISFEGNAVIGHYVDHIIEDKDGCMKKEESYSSYKLPISLVAPTDHAVSRLADSRYYYTMSCYKFAIAILPALFVTAFIPFFLRYSRNVRPYLFYLIALIAFLLFFSLLKTFIILGKNYVVAPVFSLILFPMMLEVLFFYRLCKT